MLEVIYGESMSAYLAKTSSDSLVDQMTPAIDQELAAQHGFVAFIESGDSIPPTQGSAATLYFEDINKLRIGESEDSSQIVFRLTREGTENTFEIIDSSLAELAEIDESKARDPELAAEESGHWDGWGLMYSVTVPGRIQAMEGFDHVDGRTATFNLSEERLRADFRNADSSSIPRRLWLKWSSPDISKEEIAAFREEMEAAKRRFAAQQK